MSCNGSKMEWCMSDHKILINPFCKVKGCIFRLRRGKWLVRPVVKMMGKVKQPKALHGWWKLFLHHFRPLSRMFFFKIRTQRD